MKKVLIALFCLLFPAVAMAVPVSVDRNVTGQFISPLIFTDSIRSVFFTATSTTATSTFPIASSTRFCLGSDCRTVWPAGSSSGFPVFIQNGTTTRNTGTTTLNFSANSFALTEPTADDNFTIRVSTSTLGLLASAIGDFTATVRTSISEIIPGISYNSGTGEFSLDSGSVIPTTTRAVNWDNAFLWGNHALQGYITSGQAVGTTTNGVVGEIPYWTGTRTLGTVATGTLTENVTGLNLSATRALIGGSAVIQVDAGFSLASTSDFQRINQAVASSTALNATSPLVYAPTTGNFSILQSSGSQAGFLSAADWTTFNQKVSSTSIDTSAELRALVTDETGTGALMFGITSAMADDLSCTANQVLARNSSDTAWECVVMTAGGGGGGIATTTDNNNEVGETISFLTTDFYVGGSSSSTAEFNFDKDASRFTISSTTANATGSIFSASGALRFGSSTENVEFNFNLADTLRLFSGTGLNTFDFGALRASSTLASTSRLTIAGPLYDRTSSAGTNGMVLQTTGSGVQWVATSSLGISGGGGGTPGGSDGQVQYNNGGVFGGASSLFYDDGNNRVGIGTTTPAEILHVFNSPGNFTTARFDSGLTRGYMYAFDGDNSFNIGSLSNSIFNIKVNNQTQAYFPTDPNITAVFQKGAGSRTIVELQAPTSDPQEATMALVVDKGSGNQWFADFTVEDYDNYDRLVSINSASRGTFNPLPIAFRFWPADTGVIAERGVYSMILHPSGSINFGVSSSSIATNTLLYGATTTAQNLLRLIGSGNNERLTLRGTGELGLGTTSPSRRLTVAGGDAWIGGNLTATGTITGLNGSFTNATSTNFGVSNLRSLSSAGMIFYSNSGTQIADFGAGGGSNATFNGGVNVTGALGVTGQTTLGNFTATNGTTTNSTSTNLRVSNSLSFGGVTGTAWSAFCTAITGGSGLCDGVDNEGSGGGSTLATTTADYVISTNGTTVFAWNASTTATEFSGDFSTVLQNVVNKLDGSNQGGVVYIRPGRYVSTATTTIQGPGAVTAFTNTVTIRGAGQGATEVVVSGNTDFLHLTDVAVANISDMTIYLSGNGRGITSRGPTGGTRAFWLSHFSNLVFTSTTTHTGFGMYLGNPFRSHFENIEFYEVGSCAHFRAEDTTAAFSAFNPGDFTFYRSFCDMNNTTADVGFGFSSAGNYARINQASFDMVEVYGADVTDIGIDFGGQASHNTFTNVNAEELGIIARFSANSSIVKAQNNEVTTNYIYVFDGGRVIDLDANSQNNEFDIGEWYNDGTVTLVKDANTDTNQRNIINRLGLNNDGTILITNPATSTTIIRDVFGRNDGFSNATNTIRIGNFGVTGFLGIGSTTPSRQLTVIGDGWLSGLLTTNTFVATNATTTTLRTTTLGVGSDFLTDITGFGLALSGGALGIDTTGALDGECLVYESTGPTIDWVTCGGGGGGSSKWTDAGLFTYLTDTADDIVFGATATASAPFWWDVSATTSFIGNGGPGDSLITLGQTGVEWTLGFDDTDDSFRIASSTAIGGVSDFFRLNSTTSVLISSSSLNIADRGTRTTIGMNGTMGFNGRSDTLDHLVISGRVRQTDWYNFDCPNAVGGTQIVADGMTGCQGFSFYEDGTETLTAISGNGWTYSQLGGSTANGGSGVFANGAAAGWLTLATTTPVLEVRSRIGTIAANSSTTQYYIGFANITTTGTAYETAPSQGCFFTASTTEANWRAICRTALGTATNVDTGVPSTTITTGAGQWRTFRIEATSNRVHFYIRQGSAGVLTKVAEIANTIPANTLMNAGIWWGRTAGTQAIQFDFADLYFGARRLPPPNL